MAAGRRANSHESPHGADFDIDENWHVDFGHAGVRQMSVRQIAEAWQAGAMLESTLVWHEGLADWEEVLAVPQIARAIDALAAAPPQAGAYYPGADDLDESNDWDATVVEETGRARAMASISASSQRALPPPPNARSVGAKASSSLPPPPDVKAAFETHVWAHSTPPPPELPFARDVYARHERTVEALRFPRPSTRETPEAPTAKMPPVASLPRRERTSSAGLPVRSNPTSMVAHLDSAPLSVVRVGETSKPALLASEAPEISSRRLLIWGSLGGAALGAVLLLLWRLIAPSHASYQNSLNPESIEQASETAADSDEAVATTPVRNEASKVEQAPPPPVVEVPVAAQAASAPEPEAPANLPPPSAEMEPASPTDPVASAPPKAEATQAAGTPAKSDAARNEETKRAQSVAAAPSIKSEATPVQKEKAPSSSAPTPLVAKPAPVASSARVVEEEPPVSKAPAAPSAPDPAFNKDAAVATLNTAAAAAGRCPGSDAKGPGTVRVVFSPDGSVRSVSIVSGDFEATAAGTCVTRAFQRCKVPPFSGKPAAVSKQFVVK